MTLDLIFLKILNNNLAWNNYFTVNRFKVLETPSFLSSFYGIFLI